MGNQWLDQKAERAEMNTVIVVLTLAMTVFFVGILAAAILITGWPGSDRSDTPAPLKREPTE